MPEMPLVEVVARAGTVPPAQIVKEVPKGKVGVMLGEIVTENETGGAHIPAEGVNV